jgi:hypothetical protein
MSALIALDVAILPPPEVSRMAVEYSAALPAEGTDVLRLDADHLPHITLTQQFIRQEELDAAYHRIGDVVRDYPPLDLVVLSAESNAQTISLSIGRTPELVALHERIMEVLRGFERAEGGPGAFVGGDGRMGDVLWVSSYRLKSSFAEYRPHITLGYGEQPPSIDPFRFRAASIAACHLGRFCTCRRVLRSWTLGT